MFKKLKKNKGFSLVEVLIALIIFAITFVSFNETLTKTSSDYIGLYERTMASIVAENKLVELRFNQGSSTISDSETTLGNIKWKIDIKTNVTPVPGLIKITVNVLKKGSNVNSFSLVSIINQNKIES